MLWQIHQSLKPILCFSVDRYKMSPSHVVIGISDQMKIPVKYIGVGEGMEDLQPFHRAEFVDSLFS